MKKTNILALIATLLATWCGAFAQNELTYEWSVPIQNSNAIRVFDIQTDGTYIYCVGDYKGTVDFNPNGTATPLTSNNYSQGYLAKYDQSGILVWATQTDWELTAFGSSYNFKLSLNPSGTQMAISNVGTYSSNEFNAVFVFDNGGNRIADYRYQVLGNDPWDFKGACMDNTNAVYVYGSIPGSISWVRMSHYDAAGNYVSSSAQTTLGGTVDYLFISKVDATHSQVFLQKYNNGGSGHGATIQDMVFQDGSLYMVGKHGLFIETDFFGIQIQNPSNSPSNFSAYGYMMKLNTSATPTWVKTMGSVQMDEELKDIYTDGTSIYTLGTSGNHVSPTSSGGDFFISVRAQNGTGSYLGAYYKSTKTFAQRWDMNGIVNWGKVFHGDERWSSVNGLSIYGNSDHIAVAGIFSETQTFNSGDSRTSAGGYDAFLTLYDATTGSYKNTFTYGTAGDDRMNAVAIIGDDIYTGGYFHNTIDQDFSSSISNLASLGSRDGLLQKHSVNIPPDECADAASLSIAAFGSCSNYSGSTSGLSQDGPASTVCGATSGGTDLWFSFNSGSNTEVSMELANTGSGSGSFAVYSGTCGSLTEVTCGSSLADATLTVAASTDYLIRIYSAAGQETDFYICLQQPPADTYATLNEEVCQGESFEIEGTFYSTQGAFNQTIPNAQGADSIITLNLTVNPLPNVGANASATSICPGDAVTLTGSGAVSYTWNQGVTNGVAFNPTANQTYTVTGEDANGCVNTDQVAVSILTNTVISAQPSNETVCAGDAVSFSVSATGDNLSYQWKKGGANISGATAATYSIASPTVSNAGNYTVVVSGTCGNVTSAVATLTVNEQTAITAQPASLSECEGEDVSFSVSADGSSLSYQWKLDGTNLSGETSAVLNLTGIAAADAGDYTVVVTGACGSETSAVASLSVTESTAISAQPSNETVCAGDAVSFSVSTTGDNLSYQWKKGGANISGATAATYSIASPTASDAGNYRVVVSGTCGNVTSAVATLTVNEQTAITAQPTSLTECEGEDVSFSVSADGSSLSYQWKLDGTNLSGETSAVLNLTGIAAADAGDYTVVVTGDCGSETSAVASLSVTESTAISAQPSNETVCAGDAVSFSVSATGDNLSYQWKKGGANISGATAATYSIASPAVSDAGNYRVVVSGTCGNVTSSVATLTVNEQTAITTQPASLSECEGEDVSFSVSADGSSLSYQWKLDGTNLSGETSAVMNLTGIAAADAGDYTVVVTGACGSETSAVASLAVTESISITAQPVSITDCEGEDVSFSVSADGVSLTYQWHLDGSSLTGETASTLNVSSIEATVAGDYTVVVSGTCGSETSSVAELTVNELPEPVITENMGMLETGVYDTYQWYIDGNIQNGETNASITVTIPGAYTVEVTNNGCEGISAPYTPMTVGIKEATVDAVSVYPNPFRNEVTVELNSFDGQVEISVLDMTGRVVFTAIEGGTRAQLNLAQLSDGAYSLVVRGEHGKTATGRLIKN